MHADGIADLAASAPTTQYNWTWDTVTYPDFIYSGTVNIFLGGAGQGLASANPNVVIYSTGNLTFLGEHLSCADVNGDGLADLIIGSPMAQTDLATAGDIASVERGRVDVFYSSPAWTNGAQADVDTADLSLTGSVPYEWFGYHTDTVANVSVLTSQLVSTMAAAGLPMPPAVCTDLLNGAPTTTLATLLLVGSPGYRTVNATVGRLNAFAVPQPGTAAAAYLQCLAITSLPGGGNVLAPLWTITADASLMVSPFATTKLGAGFAVGFPLAAGVPYLAVGAPNTDLGDASGIGGFNTSAGLVVVAPVPQTAGNYSLLAFSGLATATLISGMPDARFGWNVMWAHLNADNYSDLVVAAPMYTPIFIADVRVPLPDSGSSAGAISGRRAVTVRAPLRASGDNEAGAVMVYLGGAATFPRGRVSNAETAAAWRATGDANFGRFGAAIAAADWDDDGSTELIVGAPRATEALPTAPDASAVAATAAVTAPSSPSQPRKLQAATATEMPGAVYVFKIAT